MPNPQLHVAIGMLGTLILISIAYPLISKFYSKEKAKRIILLFPILILIGSFLSIIPDVPELSNSFPSLFNQ